MISALFPVMTGIVRSVAWFIGLALSFLAGAVVIFVVAGDASWFRLAVPVSAFMIAGVVGSFIVHEMAHAVVLHLAPGVEGFEVERTAWRFSVIPYGCLTARMDACVAAAGPLSAAGVGLVLLPVWAPGAWCYLVHVVFLLPFFGDGRSVVRYLLGGEGLVLGR